MLSSLFRINGLTGTGGLFFSRPHKRLLLFLLLWTCLCYFVFRINFRDDLIKDFYNTRELLAKVVETGKPRRGALSGSGAELSTTTSMVNIFDAQPAVDRSPSISETDLVNDLQKKLPNLPIVYLQENKNKNWHYKNQSSCAKFPALYDLHFNNIYWQETETSNGTFFFYGAYLDVRKKNQLGPTVRILSMINRIQPTIKTFCQLWFKGSKEPLIAKVYEYKYIWYHKWGNYKTGLFQPYLIACPIPKSHWHKEPVSVSVVEHMCDIATNNLRVTYNKLPPGTPKKEFAVCVKGLDFPSTDLSVRLVEWIETLHTLGADKVFLYNLEIHPNVTKVLNHYVDKAQHAHLQHLYLKSKLTNKRQNELIPYNDCLYRNMYRYEYIALLDIDEVITPIKHSSWSEMMKYVRTSALAIKNETRASYNFRNVRTWGLNKELPPYLHMMQHVYRSANYTKPGQYIKCFHNPEKALILHNHFPLGCLGVCTSYPVDISVGHLQHYRKDCVSTLKKSCDRDYKKVSVRDTSLWKWSSTIVNRSAEALSTLGFFKNSPTGPSGILSEPSSKP
ncbi:Putative LOC100164358 [Caligus rogercresseyi]|uniref:Glycosyltransferase family 92 protein n=1 Tax=Caligus rogercresseyi TaxID=217165 RepID=A0A7T8K0G8_CALRO|nr:Putative LOC100164358 [Caligus rogercresseyi]